MGHKNRNILLVALTLIAFGVIMRLVPHPDNFAPVSAIALFAGAVLPLRFAWWLGPAVVIASDLLFLGTYNGILFTWLGFLLVGFFGMSLRGQSNWLRVPFGALGAAVIFFVVSNFGVWLQGQMYPLTWAGLVQCYEMALPFFRNTFLGDLVFSTLLFGAFALAPRFVPQPKTVE